MSKKAKYNVIVTYKGIDYTVVVKTKTTEKTEFCLSQAYKYKDEWNYPSSGQTARIERV